MRRSPGGAASANDTRDCCTALPPAPSDARDARDARDLRIDEGRPSTTSVDAAAIAVYLRCTSISLKQQTDSGSRKYLGIGSALLTPGISAVDTNLRQPCRMSSERNALPSAASAPPLPPPSPPPPPPPPLGSSPDSVLTARVRDDDSATRRASVTDRPRPPPSALSKPPPPPPLSTSPKRLPPPPEDPSPMSRTIAVSERSRVCPTTMSSASRP